MSIYLDNAATTKAKREVIGAMLPYFTDYWHNPSTLYSAGAKVREDIESARKIVSSFIGANADEIYFTSSGSESNCMALRGFVDHAKYNGYRPVVITSSIEHKSILSCVRALASRDIDVVVLGVDDEGFVNIDDLNDFLCYYCAIAFNRVLVSIMFANNEIGTVQPIEEISKIVHHYGAILHTDAVQAAGQIAIDVKRLGIDMMSVSGHKLGTPRGSAFLYNRNGVEIEPLIYGSQEKGLRGGTEASANIIGLAKAVEIAQNNMDKKYDATVIRDRLIGRLEEMGCKLIGNRNNRLPNNVSVLLPEGCGGEELMLLLDVSGVMIGVGSACNSRHKSPSHVLKAIGLSDEEAMRVVRITLPSDCSVTFEVIERAVNEIEKGIKLLRSDM